MVMGSKGTYDALAVLRAESSQPVGSENGTSIDLGGPTEVIRATLYATTVGSGGTLSTAKLQGSDDDSTFYDIPGSNFLDPSDGAAIDATGDYEVYIQTDFRYIRCSTTVATAAITHGIFLSRI